MHEESEADTRSRNFGLGLAGDELERGNGNESGRRGYRCRWS